MVFCLFFLLLCSCTPKIKTFADAALEFQTSAYKGERLKLEGWKEGAPGEALILFSSSKHVDVDEARRLILVTVRQFLPYLNRQEFDEENLIVGIQFKEADGRFVEEDFVAEACLKKGKIIYYSLDEGKRRAFYAEPYETALTKTVGRPCEPGFRPFSLSQ